MFLLAVNFHYVEEEGKYPYPGIYPITPLKFARQLDLLAKHFEFISQNDLVDALEKNKKLPEKSCLIIFDDGLKSQYENALPILQKKGVPAVFFVNGLPYKEERACLVHKVHWLRAHLEARDFLNQVKNGFEAFSSQSFNEVKVEKEKAAKEYPYDEPQAAKLKFFLNYLLNVSQKERIVSQMFEKIVKNEADFCRRFYISKVQLGRLADLSLLGLHSYSHCLLGELSTEEIKEEIVRNAGALEEAVNWPLRFESVSYPHKDSVLFKDRIGDICAGLGLKFGLATEKAFNRTLKNPFLLAKVDTNDVIGGKCPLFDCRGEAIKILKKEIRLHRQVEI